MARTIQQIQQEILTAKNNEPALSELNSTSKTAIWRLWVYITAFVIHTLEKLFDQHRKEIDEKIRTQKVFSLPWYRMMALRFQYGDGFALAYEQDYYDNTGKTEDEIEASKIVKYAAINEVEGVLVLKIATEQGGELQRITDEQEESFTYYINRIKAAGVEIRVINSEPDLLSIHMKVLYNPLILKKDGTLIQDPTEKPVENAIRKYLKNLPFNGELVLAHLTDAVQQAEGVEVPHLSLVQTKWVDSPAFENVEIKVVPKSGYFKITNFNISYEPNI
ncbi:hypothetical protein [Bergeyella zoohelcum]|uniref:Nucleotidyltransferase n=1 Tax=Bergeyella zoohelcum TaxID=1015 RepID=A0A380ZZW6_9FLAO|nr:hypothetical protein [Bergeyella zoohelcum]EKB58419.1 hypothetical protein HMPREF9700_01871 [Bergeyella zoohelcum CCUG 30536]SUV53120.1 Uncharacterised protein [Bergeyella zoohelcum]